MTETDSFFINSTKGNTLCAVLSDKLYWVITDRDEENVGSVSQEHAYLLPIDFCSEAGESARLYMIRQALCLNSGYLNGSEPVKEMCFAREQYGELKASAKLG